MSDEAPIHLRYEWTAEEFVRAHRLYLREPLPRALAWFAWLFFGVMLIFAWRTGVNAHAGLLYRVGYPVFFVSMGLILLIVRGPFQYLLVRRAFNKRPDARHEVDMIIGEDGIKAATVGMASSEMGWNAFCKAVIAPEGILLFLTPRQYLFVPGATVGEQRARLDELVRTRVAETKTLR